MKLFKEGNKSADSRYNNALCWKQADSYWLESDAEYNDKLVELTMRGFRYESTKTSIYRWAGENCYREDETFEYKTIYVHEYIGQGDAKLEKFILSKNSHKRNRTKKDTGGYAFRLLMDDFEEQYGVSWREAFGRVNHQKEFWSDCCPSPINYCNTELSRKTWKGVRKGDISSAYPYQGTKSLPTYTGHKKVKGYAEPTEEYPFAFYIKSHHLKIYNELDTRTFLERGKAVGYSNYNDDEKFDRWGTEVPEEEEVTYLLKASEYSLEPLFNKYYDLKSQEGEETERAKLIMNASIGYMHSLKWNTRNFCPYIAAVIIARHEDHMFDIINDIVEDGDILQVLTDCVIWLGKESKFIVKEKSFGAFVDELGTRDTEIWYAKTGQYAIAKNGKVDKKMIKRQGIKDVTDEQLETVLKVSDLELIVGKPKGRDLFGGLFSNVKGGR